MQKKVVAALFLRTDLWENKQPNVWSGFQVPGVNSTHSGTLRRPQETLRVYFCTKSKAFLENYP